MKNSNYGFVEVYLDNSLIDTINLFSSTSQYQKELYKIEGLSNTNHVIKFKNLGKKETSSTSGWINIDSLIVEKTFSPALQLNRYEENSSKFTFSNGWLTANSSNYSNGSVKYTKTTDAYLEFSYVGSGFKIIGFNTSAYGLGEIYVDNKLVTGVNYFGSPSKYQQVIFEDLNLPYGEHIIKVKNLGLSGSTSVGNGINIDAIEIFE